MRKIFATLSVIAISTSLIAQDNFTTEKIATSASTQTSINPNSKASVEQGYWKLWANSNNLPSTTANINNCSIGSTSKKSIDEQVNAINYVRSLAKLSPVNANNANANKEAQAAALVMAANNTLTHYPSKKMKCYSATAYKGASTSNLGALYEKTSHVGMYMHDYGDSNTSVGHRRWLLFPQLKTVGVGTAQDKKTGRTTSAIKVIGTSQYSKPKSPDYVPYPTAGYFPSPLNMPRWSFTLGDQKGSVSKAKVTVKNLSTGKTVKTKVVGRVAGAYATQPTLVWEMGSGFQEASSHNYKVTVSGFKSKGKTRTHSYTVKVFKPVKK